MVVVAGMRAMSRYALKVTFRLRFNDFRWNSRCRRRPLRFVPLSLQTLGNFIFIADSFWDIDLPVNCARTRERERERETQANGTAWLCILFVRQCSSTFFTVVLARNVPSDDCYGHNYRYRFKIAGIALQSFDRMICWVTSVFENDTNVKNFDPNVSNQEHKRKDDEEQEQHATTACL